MSSNYPPGSSQDSSYIYGPDSTRSQTDRNTQRFMDYLRKHTYSEQPEDDNYKDLTEDEKVRDGIFNTRDPTLPEQFASYREFNESVKDYYNSPEEKADKVVSEFFTDEVANMFKDKDDFEKLKSRLHSIVKDVVKIPENVSYHRHDAPVLEHMSSIKDKKTRQDAIKNPKDGKRSLEDVVTTTISNILRFYFTILPPSDMRLGCSQEAKMRVARRKLVEKSSINDKWLVLSKPQDVQAADLNLYEDDDMRFEQIDQDYVAMEASYLEDLDVDAWESFLAFYPTYKTEINDKKNIKNTNPDKKFLSCVSFEFWRDDKSFVCFYDVEHVPNKPDFTVSRHDVLPWYLRIREARSYKPDFDKMKARPVHSFIECKRPGESFGNAVTQILRYANIHNRNMNLQTTQNYNYYLVVVVGTEVCFFKFVDRLEESPYSSETDEQGPDIIDLTRSDSSDKESVKSYVDPTFISNANFVDAAEETGFSTRFLTVQVFNYADYNSKKPESKKPKAIPFRIRCYDYVKSDINKLWRAYLNTDPND